MAASAAPFSVEEATMATLHAAYLSGRAAAVSVCQAHLDRIAAYDRKGPALGAIRRPIGHRLGAALAGCGGADGLQLREPAERLAAARAAVVRTDLDRARLRL